MSVIATPPDLNVTTGAEIVSLATIVIVTTSPSFAKVPGDRFEAILTVVSEGNVLSRVTALEPSTSVSAVPSLLAKSLNVILKVILPPMSPAATV